MRYIRRFNESINNDDVEHLFVDFIDAGGSVETSLDDTFVDIFNIESDEEIKIINSRNLNPRALDIFGSFKAATINLKNINTGLKLDDILFANDYLAGYGYKFKYICLLGNTITYIKDPNDIDYSVSVRNITIVYENLNR